MTHLQVAKGEPPGAERYRGDAGGNHPAGVEATAQGPAD
jgi:hypothetical protein